MTEIGGDDSVHKSDLVPLPQSPISADQLLLGVLDLIRDSRSIDAFTHNEVARVTGLPIERFEGGEWGYDAQLTPEWRFGFVFDPSAIGGPLFDLGFLNPEGVPEGDMTGICGIDYDEFASGLTDAGFTHQTLLGEHGRRLTEEFRRGAGLHVTIATQGEASAPLEKQSHQCITLIQVRADAHGS